MFTERDKDIRKHLGHDQWDIDNDVITLTDALDLSIHKMTVEGQETQEQQEQTEG
jgi:hypothetical protein